jgi:hypothetical protein
MFEEEPDELLSSQISVEARLETVCEKIMARFEHCHIDREVAKSYYIDIERHDFSDIRIWFYDSKKEHTTYGLHCSFMTQFISSSLIKLINDDEVEECATQGTCDLYLEGQPRYHSTIEDLLLVIDEMAQALITNDRREILTI